VIALKRAYYYHVWICGHWEALQIELAKPAVLEYKHEGPRCSTSAANEMLRNMCKRAKSPFGLDCAPVHSAETSASRWHTSKGQISCADFEVLFRHKKATRTVDGVKPPFRIMLKLLRSALKQDDVFCFRDFSFREVRNAHDHELTQSYAYVCYTDSKGGTQHDQDLDI
jgi:hypothetical protein